jgi:ubiquinone/menaquinone biosynthesis C-methylase UbiE
MTDYYSQRLSAERLRRCYDIAPPRVQQYLQAESQHVADRIRPPDAVLELGCGYGRVLQRLAGRARMLVGIDTSLASLQMARELLAASDCRLIQMNAVALGFRDHTFDVVVCIQNGLSAFGVDPRAVIGEALRVTRPRGLVMLSSYSNKFWEDRLAWFRLQADHGLLGEIDETATGEGVIICKDGFRATTFSPQQFESLAAEFNLPYRIDEVEASSLFCEIEA